MPDVTGERLLCGWGRAGATRALLVSPRDGGEIASLFSRSDFSRSGRGGMIARGLGRSYGDAAQCAGGTVVDTTAHLTGIGEVGPSGEVEVGAGTSLDELVRQTLHKGWFLPVTPGTRHVTVGGAFAADVHGKNHHVEGSFARHTTAITLSTPEGEHRVSAADDPELFWATAGGMGLTGIVTSASIRMLPVETDRMLVDTDRFSGLDAVMAAMEEGDERHRYSVAWVDCSRSGRAVLTRGDHARLDDLPPGARRPFREHPVRPLLRAPGHVPNGLINRVSIAALNEVWYRRAPAHREAELQSLWHFFYPLDAVADWNRLYGASGFLQYQFAVPLKRGDVVALAIRELSRQRVPSSLAVLKRFGPASPGPLSFPMPGWTLALDVPIGAEEVAQCLDRLDDAVGGAGGRVYLAKDSRLRPDLVPIMYPRLAELHEVRRRVDPGGVLRSDLSRRLGLD
ncbi:MAG: FAD-binding oxidoreductase [Actinomycetota bacterium]|nr:FAD-binding oxidoreductase [Actinomycetota bacterium]